MLLGALCEGVSERGELCSRTRVCDGVEDEQLRYSSGDTIGSTNGAVD
ncbi:hypothetical protein MICAK_2540006 [Microcystis aeruginosa PCC 9701]|uniref:Uncharacterized protein n=1 Tax=Microcystis aeruginosa PCC 9701 TaxID=721123 RepID=I4IQL1_MICAE|nr:hypothetical protein MICAK_2540006 [Microcystis aeruginosa PCC 9701]